MIVSNRMSDIRYKLKQSGFLTYTYLIFLSGFFLSPNNHLHRNFFYLFVLVPFLICLDSKFIKNSIKSKLFICSVIFLLYFLTSMLWTDGHLTSEEYYDQFRYFLMLVVFILATMSLSSNSEKFFGQIQFCLSLVASIAAIGYVFIFYAHYSFPRYRVGGPFDYTQNPNQAAMFFGFVGILAFWSYFYSKKLWAKPFYGFVLFIIIAYLFMSQSRGPIFGFLVTLILGFILEKRWKEIGITLAIWVVVIFLVEKGNIGVRSLLERGMADRIDIWIITFKRLIQAPVLGEGYFTDVSIDIHRSLESSPHNLLLLVMLKSGAIGGGLLILLVITALVHSYKYFLASGSWIFICVLAYFITCMTFDSTHLLYKPDLGWLIFWMPIGLIAGEEIRLKNHIFSPQRRRDVNKLLTDCK